MDDDDTVSVYLGNGQLATEPPPSDTSDNPVSIELYDFNNDGNLDVVTADAGNFGDGDTVSVQLGNGDGSFKAALSLTIGNGVEDVNVSDTDGDGNGDIVVTNTTSTTAGDGTGGESIYGSKFDDEWYEKPIFVTHNSPGLLSMANSDFTMFLIANWDSA